MRTTHHSVIDVLCIPTKTMSVTFVARASFEKLQYVPNYTLVACNDEASKTCTNESVTFCLSLSFFSSSCARADLIRTEKQKKTQLASSRSRETRFDSPKIFALLLRSSRVYIPLLHANANLNDFFFSFLSIFYTHVSLSSFPRDVHVLVDTLYIVTIRSPFLVF